MPFFDLHTHPSLKSLFSENSTTDNPIRVKQSPWENIDKKEIPNILGFDNTFPSQSNFKQLSVNGCNLVGIALYIPEPELLEFVKKTLNSWIVRVGANRIKLLLQPRKIDSLLESSPYDILTGEDWATITDAEQFDVSDRRVIPLKSASDYREDDDKNIYAVFSVEGCHTLSSKRLDSHDFNTLDSKDIIKNLDKLREDKTILSLGLVHLTCTNICNQAFAVPENLTADDSFKPTGKGISPEGREIVEYCWQNNILIDVKHMSLGARYELFDMYKKSNNKQPIICSHAGFTGISTQNITDCIKNSVSYREGYVKYELRKPQIYGTGSGYPAFNPSSINLFDEDIVWIVKSGGLIGISMDRRILGFNSYNSVDPDACEIDVEYVSAKDNFYFKTQPPRELSLFVSKYDVEEMSKPGNNTFYERRYFMMQVLHFIEVTQRAGILERALKQICIGSDFDGIIDPIYACSSVEEYDDLKRYFVQEFRSFVKFMQRDLPSQLNIKKFAEDLFYNNGKNFVINRLSVV